MRLVILSTVLSLALGVVGCAAPTADSIQGGSEPTDEMAEPASPAPEIKEKATKVVTAIEGLLKLNRRWNERLKGGATTPEQQHEIQQIVEQMRDTLAALPDEAAWVERYVQEHRDAIKAGFEGELASEPAQKGLGPEKIQKLTEAVKRAGGVDQVILKSAASLRAQAQEIRDRIAQGKKMPISFFCALAGTLGGANAARELWRGLVVPVNALMNVGCIH
jgi:hypothetical protein